MQATDDRNSKVKAPALVAMVIGLHVIAVGSIFLFQGCGTTGSSSSQVVEPPPSPIQPPRAEIEQPSTLTPKPVFQPPVAVETATPAGLEAGQTYVIQKGDLLSSIAYRYGVSAREVAELNGIKDPNKIRVGQKILLPSYARSQPLPKKTKSATTTSSSSTKSTSSSSASAGAGGDYVVKAGDSLSKVAARNGTTVKALREANGLKSDMIRIGQKLTIPGGKATAAAVASEPAAQTDVSAPVPVPPVDAAPALESAPASTDVIPVPPVTPVDAAPAASASTDVPFEYTLKAGETLDDVARNFAVLKQEILALNGISDEASVSAGAKLKIPMSSQ